MLSIGRKPGEYVMIGDDICVKVISVDGMLRLAIEAPRDIPIVRGELYEKKLAEQGLSTKEVKPEGKKKGDPEKEKSAGKPLSNIGFTPAR